MKKKPTKKRCRCGARTNDFYCASCTVAALNKIIAAGGRRVNVIAETEFQRLTR